MKYLSLDGLKKLYKGIIEIIDKKIKKSIDDIEIGGENLIDGSKDFVVTNADSFGRSLSVVLNGTRYKGLSVRRHNLAWNFYRPYFILPAGTYTFSCYAKSYPSGGRSQIGFGQDSVKAPVIINLTEDWVRYSASITIDKEMKIAPGIEATKDFDLYVCGIKLEKGSTATDYTESKHDLSLSNNLGSNVSLGDNLYNIQGNEVRPGLTATRISASEVVLNTDGTYQYMGIGFGSFKVKAYTVYYVKIICDDTEIPFGIWDSDSQSNLISPSTSREFTFNTKNDTNISIAASIGTKIVKDLHVKCILSTSEITTQYEPFCLTNFMLDEMKANKTETTTNLFKATLSDQKSSDLTCTSNGDGTYVINGTAKANGEFTIGKQILPTGRYKLVGKVTAYIRSSTDDSWYRTVEDNDMFCIETGEYNTIKVVLYFEKGESFDNLLIKPMITTNLNATYDDFVPYTGNNGKLNKDVSDLLKRIEELEKKMVNTTSE